MQVWAGIPGREGHQDGEVGEATLRYPYLLAEDSLANLYIVERNRAHLRKISPTGRVNTLVPKASGSAANMGAIWSIAVAPDDTIYLYSNSRLWNGAASEQGDEIPMEMGPKVSLTDFVLTPDESIIATSSEGRGLLRISWSGAVEEIAGSAVSLGCVALSSSGDLYVTEDHRVLRKRSGSDRLEHFAPVNERPDERGPETWFTESMEGIDLDGDDNLYIADGFGYLFRASSDGIVSIVADLDEDVTDVLVSRSGHIYITDYYNHVILRSADPVTPNEQARQPHLR